MYEQYIGREIQATEKAIVLNGETFIEATESPDDPVLAELSNRNSNLRVMMPGQAGTTDWDPTRLNVNVEKSADGKYRIRDIHIG